MSSPAVLAYWDIRGLAQPIRYLLEYTGTLWEDKLYSCGPAPKYDKSAWFNEKFNHGLDFPNLPYYIDGSVKLTQSYAILKYLARKHDLVGSTDEEKIRQDLIESQCEDFRSAFTSFCYNSDFENIKGAYLEALPSKLKAFCNFLGTNPWFAGKKLTYVDFCMYEILDQHLLLDPGCLKPYQNLVDFQERFEKLKGVSSYKASSRCLKYPLNNKHAKFGG